MDSRTEAFLAEAKRLSLSPDNRAEVRQVVATHQTACSSLNLDPAEKALCRKKLKESMQSKQEPWWQVLLHVPQLSLPVTGVAVFLLVFATGGITSLRWLTQKTEVQPPVVPVQMQNMESDLQLEDIEFAQPQQQGADVESNDVASPTPLPVQRKEAMPATVEDIPTANSDTFGTPMEVPQVQEMAVPFALPAIEDPVPLQENDSGAAGQAAPAADSMMMEAVPMMMKAVPTMMQMPEDDEGVPGMMRMMKSGSGAVVHTGTGEVLPAPETASGELLR